MNNRKQRRAVEGQRRSAIKQVAKANGQAVPSEAAQDPALLALRVKALENGLEKLVAMRNDDIQSIKKAFQLTDQHFFILQRILNDFANHQLRCIPMFEGDTVFLSQNPSFEEERNYTFTVPRDAVIDINWYFNQYYQAYQFSMFLDWVRKITVEAKSEEPMIVSPSDESVSYFGGNYKEGTAL